MRKTLTPNANEGPEIFLGPLEDATVVEKKKKTFFSPLAEAARKMARITKDKGKEWAAKYDALTKSVREIVRAAHALDADFFSHVPANGERLAKHVEQIKTVDALALSSETEKKSIGEAGVNQTTRRKYRGPPPKTAYVKGTHGELFFDHEGRMMQWNAETMEHEPSKNQTLSEEETSFIRSASTPSSVGKMRQALAKKFGIHQNEVPLDSTKREWRDGLLVGGRAMREYAASRLDMMLGLDVVPVTVMRSDGDDLTDLCSVQEAVASVRQDFPVRGLYKQEADILFQEPAEAWTAALRNRFRRNANEERVSIGEDVEDLSDFAEWEEEGEPQKSLMRIACLDYLIGSMDRHYGNLLYDPVSMKFHAIDNGLSFGMATDVDDPSLQHISGNKAIQSIPLEVVWKNPYLSLDREMKNRLESLLNELRANGPEASLTKKLFLMLFPKQEIARVEQGLFIKRLEALVHHGYPPMEEITPHLLPIGIMRREQLDVEAEPERKSATRVEGKKRLALN